MKNIVELSGADFNRDKELIEKNINNQGAFILMNQEVKLDVYLGYMHEEKGIKNRELCRLKICRQFTFSKKNKKAVSVAFRGEEQRQKQYVNSVLDLLRVLDPGKKVVITIENDSRTLLAEIMQQLVYIEYEISNFEIRLASEVEDANKTEVFMKNIDEILHQIIIADENIHHMQVDDKLREIVDRVGNFFSEIKVQVEKAKAIEMKIAVAASKKTGKSVIANCMFGMELAPTSLEMATPNTCVYKKSKNSKFSVTIGSQKTEFAQKDEIRKYLGDKFKEAQNDASNRFAIEDMVIEYPANGNNFESYTIYDTPGPDAAGTAHHESAEKAIQECDVAIFAIDFSKYLTNSEEKFLGDVKQVFEEKGKFHTLIFCINKIDLMFQDTEPISKIKKIEFIRNRLKDIDSKYSDCVIFGTSALDYFNTLEVKENEDKYQVLEGIGEMDLGKNNFFDNASAEIKDDTTMTILANIERAVVGLRRQFMYDHVTIDTIQNFSGMPQLLHYISYIAKNKARKEIVNSITYAISRQMSQIQDEINRRENLKIYIQANEEKKRKIKETLSLYEQEFDRIATSDTFTEDDICYVEGLSEGKIKSYFNEVMKWRDSYKTSVRLEELFTFIVDLVKFHNSEAEDVIQEVQERIEVQFCKKLEDFRGQYVDIENVAITSSMVEEAFQFVWSKKTNQKIVDIQKILEDCIEGIRGILSNRFNLLREKREKCTEELERNDIKFELASIPDFAPAIHVPEVNQLKINLIQQFDIGSDIVRGKKINGIHQFFRNLIKNNFEFGKKEVMLTDQIIEDILKQMRGSEEVETSDSKDIRLEVYTSLIPGIIVGYEELKMKINREVGKIVQEFTNINNRNMKELSSWIEKIDNTKEIDKLIRRVRFEQSGLDKIAAHSGGFMKLWNEVVKG